MDKISMVTDDDLVKNKYTKHSESMKDPESIDQFYKQLLVKEESSNPHILLKIWNNYYNWAK